MSSLSPFFSLKTEQLAAERFSLLEKALSRLENAINRFVEFQPKPFVFLKSNNNNLSSNVVDGTIILTGTRVPDGHRAIVQDFNLNFTTTAGTVRFVILNADGTIRIDVLRNINSSVNGTGNTVLEEGEMLAVAGQTAGAGVFSVFCSGYIQRVR